MTGTENIDGTAVRYKTTGEGPDIVLLHGWGCTLDIWKSVQEHLQDGFRVTSIDFPGFGESPEPPAPWGMEEYAALLERFVRRRGITDPILVGHSFGGRVSLLYASRNPVRKMVLVDSAGVKPRRSPHYYAKVWAYKAAKRILPLIMGRRRGAEAIERRRNKSGSADYNAASGVMRATLVKVVNRDLRPEMPLIEAPTLLVWGENDTATPLVQARVMEKRIKDSGLVVFSGAGHYSFLERPAQFAAVLDSFLGNDKKDSDKI